MQASSASTSSAELAVFLVGSDAYVVDIMRVQEILRVEPMSPMQGAPNYVAGLMNVRGQAVPVIAMRERLGLPAGSCGWVVALWVDGATVGLLVDRVVQVVRVKREAIQPPSALLEDAVRGPFFAGVVYHEGRALTLLDVRRVLGDGVLEACELTDASAGVAAGVAVDGTSARGAAEG